MRLSVEQTRLIRDTAIGEFGPAIEIVLFGSRLNDNARGGDIDLLIAVPDNVARPALRAARLAVLLERKLEGRKVDVVLTTPATTPQPIHAVARHYGIRI